jgi:two-component system, NarL family, nitrate/nitrite response regulator NarL
MSVEQSGIRILLAEDQAIFREGLRRRLDSEPGLQVLAEAASAAEAFRLVKELRPDVFLLDFTMPGLGGMRLVQRLKALRHSVCTILLTSGNDEEEVGPTLQACVGRIVPKTAAVEELIKAIRGAAPGEKPPARPHEGNSGPQTGDSPVAPARDATARPFGLTPRELEIVATIVSGCSNREIAHKLAISEETVKHHLTNVYDKVGVYNRLELALFAIHHGLGHRARPHSAA